MKAVSTPPVGLGMQVLCLIIALSFMLGGTAYPPLLMTSAGKVDHALATDILGNERWLCVWRRIHTCDINLALDIFLLGLPCRTDARHSA